MKKYRILFTDLDGTIIDTRSGDRFPNGFYDWKFKTGIINAIKGYKPNAIFIVTNQGGIKTEMAKNLFKHKINTIYTMLLYNLVEVLSTENGGKAKCPYIDYKICFSENESNRFRKPNPGMISHYIELFKLKPEYCLMIGDASGKVGDFSDSDKKAAENAGIRYMDVEYFIHKYNPENVC